MFLYQHVYKPTRYRPNATPHILDLILTNEENMVNDLQYLPGLGSSDRVCLRFNLACYCKLSTCCKTQFDLRSANFTKMHQSLETIDWHANLDPLDTLQTWDYFADHFESFLKDVYHIRGLAVKSKICLCLSKLYISKIGKRNFGRHPF